MHNQSPSIIGAGKLDLESLRRVTGRPALFAPHEALFWDDPHIARQMLAAHLDPNWNAASYRHETIDRSVAWLASHLRLAKGQRVLDLGCGPGLYCTRLSRYGLAVTGIDFSRHSIDYATQYARENDLDVTYIYANYLTLEYEEEFDAAFLIYYDFGVFADQGRDDLLTRIHRALKPGGAFVFDVMTPRRARRPDGETTWEVCPSGFWKPGPYLALTQFFQYPEAEADLQQTIVVEEDGRLSVYRLWDRYYSIDTITPALEARGFRVQDVWSDLTGRPYQASSESLGIVARKV